MKIKKIIFQIVKVLIILISITYIIFKIYNEKQQGSLFVDIQSFTIFHILSLFGILALVLVNWFIETLKFKLLIKPLQILSIYKSFQAVLAGITISIFTPNRVGDFGGRIFALDTENRTKGIFASLIGNLSQLLVTLIAGLILFPFYVVNNDTITEFLKRNSLVSPFILLLIIVLLLLYFNLSKMASIIFKFKKLSKYTPLVFFIKKYSNPELLKILLFSLLRYLVFTFQFFVLLKIFGIQISYPTAMIGISQVYFFMTILPTYALGELGVRGSVSLWILGVYTGLSSGILLATIFLWVFNLALPALMGSYFLSKFKY